MNMGAVFCAIVCAETRHANTLHTSMVEQVAEKVSQFDQHLRDKIVTEVSSILAGEEEDHKARHTKAARMFYEILLPQCSVGALEAVVQHLCDGAQPERKSMLWKVLSKQKTLQHCLHHADQVDALFLAMQAIFPLLQGKKVRMQSYDSWWNHKDGDASQIVEWAGPAHVVQAQAHLSEIREAMNNANTTTARWKQDIDPSSSFLKLALYHENPKAWQQHMRARLKM